MSDIPARVRGLASNIGSALDKIRHLINQGEYEHDPDCFVEARLLINAAEAAISEIAASMKTFEPTTAWPDGRMEMLSDDHPARLVLADERIAA